MFHLYAVITSVWDWEKCVSLFLVSYLLPTHSHYIWSSLISFVIIRSLTSHNQFRSFYYTLTSLTIICSAEGRIELLLTVKDFEGLLFIVYSFNTEWNRNILWLTMNMLWLSRVLTSRLGDYSELSERVRVLCWGGGRRDGQVHGEARGGGWWLSGHGGQEETVRKHWLLSPGQWD